MTPLVSVVVATYNRPTLLFDALSSVLAQREVPGIVEAVVVNDGGTDISSTIDRMRERGLLAHVINLATNRGLPSARNVGIETARGDFVAFLDDDDVYRPDHIAVMLAAIERHNVEAAYGICTVSTRRVDPSSPSPIGEHRSYPFDADLLSVANLIPVHAAVLRRLPWQARFDSALPALEDWDMWLRLTREHGYRFHQVPQPTVVYHRIPNEDSMCGPTATDGAALAHFGKIAERTWRRWPARTATVERFRLYIAVMYWHALSTLAEGGRLSDDYFQRCVSHIEAAWHGDLPESRLTERIIESIKDGADAATAG